MEWLEIDYYWSYLKVMRKNQFIFNIAMTTEETRMFKLIWKDHVNDIYVLNLLRLMTTLWKHFNKTLMTESIHLERRNHKTFQNFEFILWWWATFSDHRNEVLVKPRRAKAEAAGKSRKGFVSICSFSLAIVEWV